MSEPIALPVGFRAASAVASIKPKNLTRPDLALLVADRPSPAQAVFTRNQLVGAHVHLCREHLAKGGGQVRAVLVNAGNANCATGQAGIDDARRVCEELAARLECPPEQVLFLSTGVIGARLPVDRVRAALPGLVDRLSPQGFDDFAQAIMTTDTFPKARTATGAAQGQGSFRVTGAAKGAGMIHPDMATLLAFLTTDAQLAVPEALVQRIADQSFHRVTVDGDTSPNDTLLLWSSGARRAQSPEDVESALVEVAQQLARCVAKDGEGATRCIAVQVRGAASPADALCAAKAIATSPLVKTAVNGRDPNWGRILAAAGRSGAKLEVERARVWIGPAQLYENGAPQPANEPAAHRHLADLSDVVIGVDLGAGAAEVEVWTCDLSAEYVRINADYRS